MTDGAPPQGQQLPKRFYKEASVEKSESGSGYELRLDGRQLKTPGKKLLLVPSSDLAQLIASEWTAQVEVINPATMPVTKIINSSLDGVSGREAEVAADIVSFAGSDLLCYRAEGPVELVKRQADAWNPVLAWAREAFGAQFVLAEGVMPVAQPEDALAAYAEQLKPLSAIELGAMHVLTTLSGSALLALGLMRGHIDADAAWAAAHIDEDYQIEQWGPDEEAAERRQKRWAEFEAASLVIANCR
ncbi:MAG: ATP12 family protein [Filomicrobium sp.]